MLRQTSTMHVLHDLMLLSFLLCLGTKGTTDRIKALNWCKNKSHEFFSFAAAADGTEVPDGKMPYMVSVQNATDHICGGFLYNEEFVITAAHCDVE